MNNKSNGQAEEREEGNRRASLLSAAAKLFREKGFEATTIRDIAGAVGMGSGSPFCHFRSKQHILGCIVLEGMGSALSAVETLKSRRMAPVDRFRALMRLHIANLHRPDSDFVAVMLYEWRALTPENLQQLMALMERYESVWHDCLLRMQRAGLLTGNLSLIRQMILGATNWSLRWFRPEGPLSVSDLGEATSELFLGMLAPEQAAAPRRSRQKRRPTSADFRAQSAPSPS